MTKEELKKYGAPIPKGVLLIIGGAENKGASGSEKKQTPDEFQPLEILNAFISLTNKKDPVIEVITSASGESNESFADYQKAFRALKLTRVGHIHHNSRGEVKEDVESLERIQKADAIFFTGGDQLRYTSFYGGTSLLTALKTRYIQEKIVIAGTSAGAMALSTPMIYAGNDEVQELGGMIKITTGLEFLRDVCIDTHFVSRGRVVRMAQVVVTNPTCIGLGIEEDTAMIVRNGIEVEVIGSGTIIVLEGFEITEASVAHFTSKEPISIRDMRMHILSGGDKYVIQQRNPPHI